MLELIVSALLGAVLSWLVTLPFQRRIYRGMRTMARLAALEPGKRESTGVNYSDGILGTSFGAGWPTGLEYHLKASPTGEGHVEDSSLTKESGDDGED